MKKNLLIALSLASCLAADAQTQGIENVDCLFDEAFQAKTVSILSQDEARQRSVPLALVRNPNGKLAIMSKDDSGALRPYYMRGIEVGFWDTRRRDSAADYDTVFETYRKLGANAAMFMIHWSDIEPEDGKFDFSYTDAILEKAKRHGVKIVWVLFMHEQFDMPFLTAPEKLWMYNLDTRDGANYAIQWVKDKEGNVIKDIPAQRAKKYSEIMPCYSHPVVYGRIVRMLGRLADHYRNSESVIGVQIGNEEHVSYQGEDADFNPYTLAHFEKWKAQSGETSWNRFKLAIVKLWFSRFTTAYHLHDPYKITMMNPIAGGPEKGETGIIDRSGTDATTFRDSRIDAIATMFYWPTGVNVWKNLDQVYKVGNTYSYPTQLPLLMSTEIGIRSLNTWPYTQEYMVNFIERGSQGFAVYSYGHVASWEGSVNEYGEHYRKFMAMVAANEDVIWPGLPGIGDNVTITSTYGGGKISCLYNGNGGSDATLGILHYPDDMADDAKERRADIPVEVMVRKPGRYTVEIYKDGVLAASHVEDLKALKAKIYTISISNKEIAFVKVKRQ